MRIFGVSFSSLRGLIFACALVCAGTAAFAQNFGSVNVGSSSTATITVTLPSEGTVGSISVRLLGAENLDFTNAGGGTCAVGTAYASNAICTVNVTFAPKAPGLRRGAVVLFSGAGGTGTVLANAPVYGVGLGPMIGFGSATAIAIDPIVNGIGLTHPLGLTLDGAGDLFIADSLNNRVVEVPAGGGASIAITPEVNGIGLNTPSGVALDGAGDLFIVDQDNNRVVELPAGGGAATAIDPIANFIDLHYPFGAAVDAAGDFFVTDQYDNRVVELPAGGGTPTAITPMVGQQQYYEPTGVAVDGAGDVFMAGGEVFEVPIGSASPILLSVGAFGLALDGMGNLFLTSSGGSILELPPGGGATTAFTPTVNGFGLSNVWGVVVDAAGNIFAADAYNDRIVEIERSQPAPVTFATTNVGSISSDSPQTVQVEDIGNEALVFTAIGYPVDFPVAASSSTVCGVSSSVGVGQQCTLPVGFRPKGNGLLSEQITLADNALNTTSTQAVTVSGMGQGGPVLNATVRIQSSALRATQGWPVTFTAFVSGSGALPGGMVNFFSGSTLLGTGTLSGGAATFTTSSLALGSYSITATFVGDPGYNPATSVAITEVITNVPVLLLTSSTNPARVDAPFTLTASVESPAGGAVPTGMMVFYLDGQHLGLAPLSAGVATWQISGLAVGQHALGAQYGGDTHYKGIGGVGLWETVTRAATSVAVAASPASSYLGSTVTVTATVATTLTGQTPTGTVKLFLNHVLLGASPLVNGVATYTTSSLALGTYALSAQYSGDSNYAEATTPGTGVYVYKLPTNITLSLTVNSTGTYFTLTAVVATNPAGHGTPTGTVTAGWQGDPLATMTLSGGVATWLGTVPTKYNYYTFLVQYSGDADDAGSTATYSTFLSSSAPK